MWKQAQYLQMKENSVLSLQKYPFTRRSDEEKKRIKELGPDRPYFQFVCAPPHFFAPPTDVIPKEVFLIATLLCPQSSLETQGSTVLARISTKNRCVRTGKCI